MGACRQNLVSWGPAGQTQNLSALSVSLCHVAEVLSSELIPASCPHNLSYCHPLPHWLSPDLFTLRALRWTPVGLEEGSHGPMSRGRMLQTWTSFFPQNCAILVSLSALPAHNTDGGGGSMGALSHTYHPCRVLGICGFRLRRATGCTSMLSVSWGCWRATR